jgi:Short C-terminal domain
VLLVPKQLQRVGMTGSVPYYGGRFTPAQAYAASHPSAQPPSFADPITTGGAFVRAPVPAQGPDFPAQPKPDAQLALQQLLDAGVITEAEFQQLRARVAT